MAKKAPGIAVGDLVARVEAPTVLHRVTSRHPPSRAPAYVRILPYRRGGRDQILIPVRQGGRTVWTGDGSVWSVVGHS